MLPMLIFEKKKLFPPFQAFRGVRLTCAQVRNDDLICQYVSLSFLLSLTILLFFFFTQGRIWDWKKRLGRHTQKKEFKRNCNQKIGWEPTKVGYTGNDPVDHDQVKAGRNSMNK